MTVDSGQGERGSELLELELKKRFLKEKRQRKLIIISLISVAYSVFVLIVFGSNKFFSLEFFDFGTSNKKITILEQNQERLDRKLENLTQTLNSAKSPESYVLFSKLEKNEGDIKNLQQSILEDPDKALTSRLLREKQENLNKNFDDVKSNVAQLGGQIDRIFWTIIIVPLLGLIGLAFKENFFKKWFRPEE
ncbi:MAG: hypothetical protein HYY10_00855 [Candidatus Liptonbacteria bacterium]|nr:hypothetical protein [Candidatus Liptonbacteria bacterium]